MRSLIQGCVVGCLLAGAAVATAAAEAPRAAGPVAPAPPRWAQLTQTSFQQLTHDQGLPNAIASAVAEDGAGFLWVGTLGGMARWDGYRFRVYKADANMPGSLPDNVVQTLHGDAAGRLWVGTSAAGLARYDPDTDRFVSYPAGWRGLSHVSVRSIADDGAGGLWVGTDGGLDHLNPVTGTVRRWAADSADGAGLPGDRVQVLLRDRNGTLWAGTPAGLFRRPVGAARFETVALRAGTQPEPQSLLQDSGGRLWVGTLRHGAFVLAAGGAPARPVLETGAALSDAAAGSAAALGASLQTQQVTGLAEGQAGEVWVGTLAQGIVAVDAASGHTRRIRNLPAVPLSLSDNAVRWLYRDRSGLLWVASNRGLSRHDTTQAAVRTMFGLPPVPGAALSAAIPPSTEISWILPAPDGRVWLGTHKTGVHIVDPAGGPAAALLPDAAHPDSALPQDVVLSLERAADGSVFVGTKRGLYRASADGRSVRRVHLAGRDPSASTWALLADGDTLWIGGHNDGLWKLDLRSGASRALLRTPGRGLSDDRVVVLARGGGGSLWIGTRYGLNRYQPPARDGAAGAPGDAQAGAQARAQEDGHVQRIVPTPGQPGGLSAGFITTLFIDRMQRLWVGTYGGGVNLMLPDAAEDGAGDAPRGSGRARFQQLGTGHGLPDDNVNAVLDDNDGRLWVSTDNGLARIDPKTMLVHALRRAEGVVFPTYWTGSAARTASGEMLFGGAGGVTIVQPERVQTWAYRPLTVVTDIRIGGQGVPPQRFIARPGQQARLLTVPADANSLLVEFSSIDYSAPERNRYAYRLQGFNDHWTEVDAQHRLAAYTNLPPGRYTLLLRGSNRDGVWADPPLQLPLQVLPAWHQQLWFHALLLLATLGLLFAVVQLRTRLLRRRQTELERAVQQRTAELEQVSRALEEKSRVLELTSISDPLTGLRNRRFLTQHIDTGLAASQRRAAELAPATADAPAVAVDTDNVFLLIDVDHFKQVNDQHGHAAGDAVLVQLARRLQQVMRESDHLVRWGGEEFLAVARDTDRARAADLAERIRAVVADQAFVLDNGAPLAVSCSVGFACMPFVPGQPRALSWQDVVQLADLALFAAKRVGRNAWVGLHATTRTQPQGLLARMQAAPQQTVRHGEIGVLSDRAPGAVLDALQAR